MARQKYIIKSGEFKDLEVLESVKQESGPAKGKVGGVWLDVKRGRGKPVYRLWFGLGEVQRVA